MTEFTRAHVLELLEAADAAAFLSRQQHAFVALLNDAPDRGAAWQQMDAWIREGLELMADWETACIRVRRGPDDAGDEARWSDLFLRSRALVSWTERVDP